MMKVPGQNPPLSVSVWIRISTFQFHRETGTIMSNVADYFCTIGFGAYETDNL